MQNNKTTGALKDESNTGTYSTNYSKLFKELSHFNDSLASYPCTIQVYATIF